MDSKLKRIYIPMSETAFYILFYLQGPNHGYGIGQEVKQVPGTMYGTLSKMEKDGLIQFVREEEKRKLYQITDLGKDILEIELKRIKRLYNNSLGEVYNG